MNPILQIKFFSMNILLKTKRLIIFPQSQPFSIVSIVIINTIKNSSHHKLPPPISFSLSSHKKTLTPPPCSLNLTPSSFPKPQHSFSQSHRLIVSYSYSLPISKKILLRPLRLCEQSTSHNHKKKEPRFSAKLSV